MMESVYRYALLSSRLLAIAVLCSKMDSDRMFMTLGLELGSNWLSLSTHFLSLYPHKKEDRTIVSAMIHTKSSIEDMTEQMR